MSNEINPRLVKYLDKTLENGRSLHQLAEMLEDTKETGLGGALKHFIDDTLRHIDLYNSGEISKWKAAQR